jgi:hypothetical protein
MLNLPTPNPSQEGNFRLRQENTYPVSSQEGNKRSLLESTFPSWEGLGVGKKPNFMRLLK